MRMHAANTITSGGRRGGLRRARSRREVIANAGCWSRQRGIEFKRDEWKMNSNGFADGAKATTECAITYAGAKACLWLCHLFEVSTASTLS